ncbi:hypothetical protein JTB14_021819 [Gonioctena quinquepunctata]|nr:hypothetical protein JTB14_021819 [Gonioctena quinquepunctata]
MIQLFNRQIGLYLFAGRRVKTVCTLQCSYEHLIMSKEVEEIDSGILISLVQDKPEIWDKATEDYKNRNQKLRGEVNWLLKGELISETSGSNGRPETKTRKNQELLRQNCEGICITNN